MRTASLAFAALALAGCASAPSRRSAADEGYLLGEADAVKQLYWAKQALEAPRGARPAGRMGYYTWQQSGAPADGCRLSPATVAVPVFLPDPAPAYR